MFTKVQDKEHSFDDSCVSINKYKKNYIFEVFRKITNKILVKLNFQIMFYSIVLYFFV